MTTSANLEARAAQVAVRDDRLIVALTDGREISAPLTWFPRLLNATTQQRTNWRLIGHSEGIHWEDLDEDISVRRLLGLPCD